MARYNVNPTRMEQQKQKARLKTAARGHKLLKDKSDEMIRHFYGLIKQNRYLREQVEAELGKALHLFVLARVQMTAQQIEAAVTAASTKQGFTASTVNIMGLIVPKITLLDVTKTEDGEGNIPITTSPNFDRAISELRKLLTSLLELANVEKTCDMLAAEIEKNRRRINALEFKMIPQTKETIHFIAMKLAENELSNQVRLMKVKDMIASGESA